MISTAFTILLAMQAAPQAPTTRPALGSRVSTVVREWFDLAQPVGLVAGLLDRGRTDFFALGVSSRPRRRQGETDATPEPPPRPLDRKTIFEIGSVTKVFTGILLATLVVDGDAKLDDPVSALLPEGTRVPDWEGRAITLLDLATHRSSLPPMPTNVSRRSPGNPFATYKVASLYELLANYQLRRPIGARYVYSNVGVGLLGHGMSRRAGESYGKMLHERILKPLGMADTQLRLSDEQKPRFAHGHGRNGRPAPSWAFNVLAGAGGIRSTAQDLVRFAAANLGLVKDLPKRLTDAMALARIPRRDARTSTRIGLCWHLLERGGDPVAVAFHAGRTRGYSSLLVLVPAKDRAAIVLVNSAVGTRGLFQALVGALTDS